MKTKKIVAEVICMILLMYFFYDGIYKIAYWSNYAFWMKNAPLLKPIWQVLTYGIPVGEILLAVGFMVPKFRVRALYVTIGGLVGFVLWVMSAHLFTNRLFWPYHAIWEKPSWMQVMLMSLGMCWMTFTVVILSGPIVSLNNNTSKSLRNTPANVSR